MSFRCWNRQCSHLGLEYQNNWRATCWEWLPYGTEYDTPLSWHVSLPGPDSWHASYPIAKGNNQSPVAILSKDVFKDPALLPWFTAYDPGAAKNIRNTGKTLRIAFDDTFDRSGKFTLVNVCKCTCKPKVIRVKPTTSLVWNDLLRKASSSSPKHRNSWWEMGDLLLIVLVGLFTFLCPSGYSPNFERYAIHVNSQFAVSLQSFSAKLGFCSYSALQSLFCVVEG